MSRRPRSAPDFVTLIASDGWRIVFADRRSGPWSATFFPTFSSARGGSRRRTRISSCSSCSTWRPSRGDAGSYPAHRLRSLAARRRHATLLPAAAASGAATICAPAPRSSPSPSPSFGRARASAVFSTRPMTRASFSDFVAGWVKTRRSRRRTARSRFPPSPSWQAIGQEAQVRFVGAEQSNVSMIVDERVMLKIYRRLRTGVQPELELARFLTDVAHYPNTPEFLGSVEYVAKTASARLGDRLLVRAQPGRCLERGGRRPGPRLGGSWRSSPRTRRAPTASRKALRLSARSCQAPRRAHGRAASGASPRRPPTPHSRPSRSRPRTSRAGPRPCARRQTAS